MQGRVYRGPIRGVYEYGVNMVTVECNGKWSLELKLGGY